MGKGGEHPGGQRTAGSSAAALPAATATRTSPSPRDPRLQSARVRLPDGTHRDFELPRGSDGEILFRQVTADLSIEEKEYFSLCFYDQTAARHWLYNDKKILKQLKGLPWEFSYEVKFYPTEPSKLVDDRARFNLYLQLRRDIYSGRLPVILQTNALLGSFAAQAEFGDAVDSPEYSNYLVHAKIAPNMNEQLAQAIAELHKQHKGQTPAEAENHYLETCRELSMYGIFLFPAKDSKNDSVMIGVGAHGINIYKDGVRMHKFSWQNIIKISYRKNSFSIKLKSGELNQKETTVTYKLEDYLHAKRVWKCAVEHHTFFRLIQPEDKPHGSFLGFGSARFRYHGRTQFQTKMASQMFDRPASATIDRSHRLSQSLTDMAREPVHPLHYTDTELDKEQLSPAMSYTLKEHGGPEKRRKHQKTVVTTTKTTKTMEYTPEQVGASRFASASTHLSAHPSSSSHSHRIALSSSAYTPHVAVQTTEGHEGPDDDRLYYSPSTTIESPTGGSYYLSDDGLRSATRSPYSPSSYPEYDPSSPYSDQYSHPAIQSYSHGTAIAVIGSGGSEQRRTQTTPAGHGEVQMRQHSTARRNLFGRPTSSGRSSRTSARLVSYHQPYDPLEPMSTLEYSDLPNTPLAQSVTVYHQGFYNRVEQQQQQEQQRERPPQRPAERPYVATTNGVHRMEELDRGDDMAERPIRHFVDIRHSGSSRPHRIKRIVHEGREEYGKEIDPKDYAFMQQQWESHPMHQTELAHELRPSNIRQHSNVYYQHTDEAGPSGMQQDDDLPRYRLIARQMPPAPPAPTEERKREREKEKKRRSGEHERRSDRGHITDSHVRAQIYQKEHTASTSIRRESPDSITRSRVSADVSSSSREGSRAAEQRTPMAAVPSPTTKEKKKKQRKRKHPKEASPQESPRRMRLIARIPPTQQSPEGQTSTSSLRFSLWKAARRTRQMDSTPEPTERYVGEMEEIGRQRELEQLDLLNRPAVSQMTPKSVSRHKTMSPIAPKRRKLIGRHRHEGEETSGSPDLSRYGYSTEPYIGHLPQFSRSSELDQSPFDSYVSSRHFEQMVASRDKPKRRAILYLGRTSSPGGAAADLHDEKREVRLIAKVLPQQKEEVASDTLKSRSKEGGTIGFMRKPKKTEKATTREIGERYEGPLSQTTYSEDIESLPLEGRPQQVSYSPVPGKVSLVTRKSSEEKEKRRAESPEKIAYSKSKHGYTFDTTPYEGPYESITYEEPLHKEHLPEFVDVYHVGVYEPAKVVEEKQRKSKEQSPEEEHKYSIGFWKKERRSHEAEEWPSSDPYTGALESTYRAHDLTKVELENRPAVVSMSPKTAHKPIPSPKASPKQAKYVLSTDPYLGDLETVRRSTDLEPSPLDSHVAVYKYEEKRTEGAKPKKKAILHIGKSTTSTDETYTEEPREVRLIAKILPQQQEFDESGEEVRDKSKERTSGLFKRGRKSQEPSPAIVTERYTGPVDDVHRDSELSELPLAVHPSVSQMPMTSARKSKSTPSSASTTERRYKLWTRVKHEGVEDEVPKEKIQITAYNFPSDKYEGELYEFGRSGELEPSSIQEHVSTLPSESIYKVQKGDKRKAILHLKRPRTASPSAEEEEPRQVRLLARVIPPSEQIEEPKTTKIGKEKSPSRFAFVRSRKSTEAKTPEQVERYSGPMEQTSYGEFSSQPLDFQPAAVGYDIKTSPIESKAKIPSPVTTEERKYRFVTKIRRGEDEDIAKKEHVKPSAYDFPTTPYEGELHQTGRIGDIPTEPLQEHVTLRRRISIGSDDQERFQIHLKSESEMFDDDHERFQIHLKSESEMFDDDHERFTMDIMRRNVVEEPKPSVRLLARVAPPSETEQVDEPKPSKIKKEKSPGRFGFMKSRRSAEVKTPELGEHYSGPLEQTSYGEFSGQPLDFQPAAVSYDIKTSPKKSKAKTTTPVETEQNRFRYITRIRHDGDEDVVEKEHVKPSAYDFSTTSYEGPLDETIYNELSGTPLDIPTTSVISAKHPAERAASPESEQRRLRLIVRKKKEEEPEKRRITKERPLGASAYDFDRSVYSGPLDETNLAQDIDGHHLHEYVNIRDIPPMPGTIEKKQKKAIFHLKSPTTSETPAEEEPHRQVLKVRVMPSEPEASETSRDVTDTAKVSFWKKGPRSTRPKETYSSMFSQEKYEGPIDSTTRRSDLENSPIENLPSISSYSPRTTTETAETTTTSPRKLKLITRLRHPSAEEDRGRKEKLSTPYVLSTEPFTGEIDTTGRSQELDGTPLDQHVTIQTPAVETKEKKVKSPKKKAVLHLKESVPETPEERPVRLIARVAQLQEEEPTTSEATKEKPSRQIGFIKTKKTKTAEFVPEEKYTGPISETSYNELSGLPLDKSMIPVYREAQTTSVKEKAPSPISTEKRTFRYITQVKHTGDEDVVPKEQIKTSAYDFSTTSYEGELYEFGRGSELPSSSIQEHVSTLPPESIYKTQKEPKRKAILHLKKQKEELPNTIEDEQRQVRLLVKVQPPEAEEPSSSAVKEKPSRQIGFIKTKKAKTAEFVPEEKYTGPISETEYNELSGLPLDKSISSRPVLPEVTKPIKTKGKKSPVVTSAYDFDRSPYSGQLDEINPLPEMTGSQIREYVNIQDIPVQDDRKKKAVLHLKRTPSPSVPEQEEHRQVLKVKVQPQEPTEIEQPSPRSSLGFGRLLKKGSRRSTDIESPILSEPYTGPLEVTTRAEELGKVELEARPAVSYSPKKIEKERHQRSGYEFNTDVYEGPLLTTGRVSDIDSTPLSEHANIYHSGIYESPKMGLKEKAMRAVTPSKGSSEWEGFEEEPREVRVIARVRHEEEQPIEEEQRTGHRFGFFKTKHEHETSPQEFGERYTGPLDQTTYNELSGQPLEVATYSPKASPMASPKSAASPSDSEKRRFRLIGVHKEVRGKSETSQYSFSTEPYQGELGSVNYSADIDSQPLDQFVEKREYDYKITKSPKISKTPKTPVEEEKRPIRAKILVRPQDEEAETSASKPSTGFAFLSKKRGHKKEPYNPVLSTATTEVGETQRSGDLEKLPFDISTVGPVHEKIEHEKPTPSDSEQRRLRLIVRKKKEEGEEPVHERVEKERPLRASAYDFDRSAYSGPVEETRYNELGGLPLENRPVSASYDIKTTPRKDKDRAASPATTEQRRFRYITRIRHPGDEDIVAKEHVKTSAYDFSTTPYEGELYEFGRGSELPSSSIQEHVSTLPSESIYKTQKEPKRKAILHLKESKSEQVTEEPQREVRLLARVIPRESEEVLQKPHEAREKSSRQFGLIKTKKTKKAEFVPEEKYTGPLNETAYNELGGLPLEHRPASASYEIKVSPKREKISAYDFSKERYEGRLEQIDRTGDLPSEPILSHVASLPKDTVLATSPKQRKIKEDVTHLKSEEPEPEQHDIRLKILVKPEQEEYEEKIKSIETSPSKIRAPFWKKTDQPTVESVYYSTEKYEGALSAESPTRELEPMKFDITPPQIRAELPKVQPEEMSPQTKIRLLAKVKGKDQDEDVIVEKPQSKPTYSFDTQVYEATEETRRQRELDPSQLRDYVAVYSSGEYAPKAVSPVKKEKKAILHLKSPRENKPAEVIEEQPHPIKLKVLVRHPSEEEDALGKQPVSPSTPLSSKFRAMIKKPAREYTTFESAKYEGPLDQTARRPDLEAMPLESRPQISQSTVSTKPIKQKKIKTKSAQYDFDTEKYHGDVQEIGRSGELDEIKLRDYITVYHTDETTETPKKKAVLHLKSPRDRPEEIVEESIPPAKLKILVRPSDEEQERKKQATAEPGTTRARGFWKRKEELQQHTPEMASQRYEGPMDETSLQKELEARSLPAAPQVKRASPPQIRVQAESTPPPTEERKLRLMTKIKRQEPEEDVIEQSKLPTHHYQFDTTPYEGNLESMGRIADIEGVPIREHVEIKEIPPSPDKHRRAILHLKKSPTPKEKSSEPELETSREVKLKVLVRPDETDDEFSRPSTSRGTSPFQFGFMKRRPQSAYSSFTTSTDAYTGPISEVSRTPEVDLLPLLATPTSSVYRSASSGDEKMQNRYKLMIRKRLSDRKSKTPDSGYGFDTQPYAGELERTPLQSELEPSDLRQIIPVYHKGESDSKTTDGKKKKKAVLHLKDTDRSPPEEPPRSVRLIALIKPTEDEKPRPKSPPGKRTAFGKSARSETQQQTAVVERYTGPVESTSKVEELEPLPLEALPILPSSDDEKPTKRAKKAKESSTRTSAVEEEPRPVRIVAQVRPEEKQIEREEKTGRGFAFFKTRSSTQEAEPSHAFEKYEGPLEVVTPGRDIENIPLPAAPAEFVQKESPKEKPHSPVLDEERRLKLMAKVRRATDEQQQQQEEPSAPSPRSGYDFSTESYEAFDVTQRHPELDTEPLQQHSAVYYHGPYYHLAKLPQKSEDEGRRFGFLLSHRKSKTPQDEGAETEKREQRLIALVRPEQQQEESVVPTGGTASRRLRMPEFLKGRRSPQGYTFPEVSGDVDQINKDSDLEKLPLEHSPAPVSYSPKYERAVTAKPKTETSSPTEERRFKLIAKVRKGKEEEEPAEKRPKSAQYATAYGYATTSSTEYPLESITPQAELQPSPMDTLERREVLSSPESGRRKRRFPFAFRSAKATGQERPEISETRLIARVRPEARESAEELNRRLELEGRQLDATRTTTIRTIVRESERTQLHDSVVSYLPSTSELRTYRPARVEGRTVDGQDYVELRVDRRVEVQLEPVYVLQSEGLGALSEDEGGIIYTSTATTMSPQSSRRSFFSRFGFTSKGSKRKKPRKGGVKEADSSESSESDDEKRQLNIVLAQSQAQESGQPHTTISSFQESTNLPDEVIVEYDQYGNKITRTVKTTQVKHTVQKQTFQNYVVDDQPGAVRVERSREEFTPVGVRPSGTSPIVETHSRTVTYENPIAGGQQSANGANGADAELQVLGEFVSSKTVTQGNRTIETVTYKTEKDGIVETHVEHRVTIHSEDPIDHDAELSQAILEATQLNPDMTVEKIEVRQESTEPQK